jgi:acetyltransferase-like isoleucine patch superfamily enzyme
MKKLLPSFLKALLWQLFLRIKHGKGNKIGRGVILSKDFISGKNCQIGKGTIIGQEVKVGNGVKIGSDCRIEKLEIDDNSCVEGRVIITGYGNGHIKIGKECYIGINNILDRSNDITIGNFVHIAGPSTGLWTHSSAKMCLNNIPLNNKSEEFRPTSTINIESNVYIGGNCSIYPGVTIGHHTVVAPNSAVTRNVEPYSMVGGVPAKKIKDLKTAMHTDDNRSIQ